MSFREALLTEMRRCGYTKAALARAVSVDKSTVTYWTNGSRIPLGRHFARLVKVMPRLKTAFDDEGEA